MQAPGGWRTTCVLEFEVENVYHDGRFFIQQDEMAADDDVLAVWRRWRQHADEFDRRGLNFLLQARRKLAADDQLFFQARRQAVFLGKPRRQMIFPLHVPLVDRVAVVAIVSDVAVIATISVALRVVVTLVVASSSAASISLRKCRRGCQ
jgi:hypothetical protein